MASITKRPNQKVSALAAPVRAGATTYTAKWTQNSNAWSSSNNARFTWLSCQWYINVATIDGKKKDKWTTKEYWSSTSSVTESTINLNNIELSNGKKKTLADLYPNTKWRVVSITAGVWGWNGYGYGPGVLATRNIYAPKAPTISALKQGESTGDVSCTISADPNADKGYQPITHTRYKRTVIDTRLPKASMTKVTDSKFTGASTTLTNDVSDRQHLSYTQYVFIKVEAWSYGIGGVSKSSSKQLYVSWPNQPVISTKSVTCPARSAVGKVTVPINLQATSAHPVTGVRLQKLVGVSYTAASQIPANAGWEDCGVEDDSSCTALSVASQDVVPAEGLHSWVRVKSWNQIEGLFMRYSDPLRLAKLYKASPTAEDDDCEIVSVESAPNGNGVIMVVGFKNDNNTGCEITWSDDPDAWESTSQPKSFTFAWKDSSSKSASWDNTATIRVQELTEGTEYFFKARRYLDGESGTTYSPWSAPKSVVPALIPSDVVLSVPSSLGRGNGCEASWAYVGGTQNSWRILSNERVVTSGTDQLGGCSISADTLERFIDEDGKVPLSVEITTAGGQASSEVATIVIADRPVLAIDDILCTEQPLNIEVLCSEETSSIALTVRAQGCSSAGPGQNDQVNGDVVWSEVVLPEWSAVDDNDPSAGYLATVVAPAGLDLRNGARYTVIANATSLDSGLVSEEATCEIVIEWSRTAPLPEAEIVPHNEVNDGARSIHCDVVIHEPENGVSTDLCDIWRITPDGEYLVCSGVAYGSIVEDPWAPYSADGSEISYRVVVRTVDGDLAWLDYPYELSAGELRIDFDGTYVELPFDLKVSDSWEKDFESRRKLDGSLDGYWNVGSTHRASFNSDLIRIDDSETAAQVKALGRYAGPCLLRSPDGRCYMAHVDVTDLSWAFTDVLMAVALDTVEVTLTSEYMATIRETPEE